MPTPETEYYFRRFGFCGRQVASPPQRDLGIVVIIPCFNEPDLIGSLESLRYCERPGCSVEVIVVVNSPANCPEEIHSQNRMTLKTAAEWTARHGGPRLAFHLLDFPELPPKHGGVGLARKIGMDEALRRLDHVGNLMGVIVGYDADCRCEPDYLVAIERHFQRQPRCPGCSIYFEHPLDGSMERRVCDAAAAYELHLRYYVQALRHAGFPYAHHTLGSCMAIRADAYRKQGGMNRRKAGEDFYFLHKIIPLGGFTDLTETVVRPSPRPSDRVPFGTGKAVRDCLAGTELTTYPLEAFLDLKRLFDNLPLMYERRRKPIDKSIEQMPQSVRTFLEDQEFTEVASEISRNTASEAAFRKRFFGWFDGFRAMKYVHHARDGFYGQGDVREQAARLLSLTGDGQATPADAPIRQLLEIYRQWDRVTRLAQTGEVPRHL